MRISTNVVALQSVLRLSSTEKNVLKSSQRINSGLKINSSKDDPAGLSIAKKFDHQISKLERANQNTLDAISLTQTLDGALNSINNVVQRMRELGVQSSNDTLTSEDREVVQREINELIDEIDSISNKTNFNGINLLSCVESNAPSLKMQVGENKFMEATMSLKRIGSKELGFKDATTGEYLSYEDHTNSNIALEACDEAMKEINNYRAYVGAFENRLQTTITNLDTMTFNTMSSHSRIIDTNLATEMTNYTKLTVISQAATSILAQANQRPQQILQLIG